MVLLSDVGIKTNMQTTAELLNLIERRIDEKGLPSAEISRQAVGNPYLIYNFRKKGFDPKFETLKGLCRALGLEFYIGPPRAPAPAESAPAAWTSFAKTTAPHRGLAKCSVQGWGKPQPERDPLPTPETAMDQDMFWVSAIGQSMIPEGIASSAFCLVAPDTQAREGDRVWVLDHEGKAAIKRLVEKRENGDLRLRGWMPIRDGQQRDFVEERLAAGLREVYPVIAVFRGKPGSETCSYIPDPTPPAHAVPPAPERIPGAITDLLGLPEGAAAETVVAAIQAQLASRGTAHATPAAALDGRTLKAQNKALRVKLATTLEEKMAATLEEKLAATLEEKMAATLEEKMAATLEEKMAATLERTLKAQTKALEEKLAATLDARLPPRQPPARPQSKPVPAECLSDPKTPEASVTRLRFAGDVRAAADAGEEVFEETEMSITIPSEALPTGLDPDTCIALRVEGDSMEPNIRSGDILVIDQSDREPLEGRAYVVRSATGLIIKRLRQEAGAWIMASDNPDFPPRPMAGEDRILGRVLWFGPEKAAVAGG